MLPLLNATTLHPWWIYSSDISWNMCLWQAEGTMSVLRRSSDILLGKSLTYQQPSFYSASNMLIWGFLVKMRYLCPRLWDWDLFLILERLTVGFLVTVQSLVCSCWAGCFTATGDGHSQWGRHPCLYCGSARHSSDFRSALGALRSLSMWNWVDLSFFKEDSSSWILMSFCAKR